MRARNGFDRALIVLAASGLAWVLVKAALSAPGQRPAEQSKSPSSALFTPAHRGVLDAVKEFFGYRPAPKQPVAFPHKVHLAKGIDCTACHLGVERGPNAGLPSVKLCMTCHQVIAADRPEIKKVAAYYARGEEIPWQRVYGYYPSAHVKFNHAPHIRAGVDCKSCHGDMTQQTVAVRSIDLDMRYCLDCHWQKKASIDCTACHF